GTVRIVQYTASSSSSFHLITDVVAGVTSVVCTALFIRFVWQPRTRFLLKSERESPLLQRGTGSGEAAGEGLNLRATLAAWMPWAILIACCALWGSPAFKKMLNAHSMPVWEMPSLHNAVQRMPPVAPPGAK